MSETTSSTVSRQLLSQQLSDASAPVETTIPAPTATMGKEALLSVGDDIVPVNTRWSFAGSTPQKFDAHVSKSVPLYAEGHELVSHCVEFFCRRSGIIIDVGCSTGTLLERLARKESCQEVSLIGYDIEADMVRVSRQRCADLENVTVRQGDLLSIDYSGANAVIMYYTLQFLPPGDRRTALRNVCEGLIEGGALLLFEKTLAPDPRTQDIVQQLYSEYKFDNGFDADEIYRKERSLRSVLAPQRSGDTHIILEEVGFSSVVTIQKYLFFEGILAIK